MTKLDPDQRDIFDKQPFTKTIGGGAAPLSSSELSSPSETCYNLVKRAFKVSKLMTVICAFFKVPKSLIELIVSENARE